MRVRGVHDRDGFYLLNILVPLLFFVILYVVAHSDYLISQMLRMIYVRSGYGVDYNYMRFSNGLLLVLRYGGNAMLGYLLTMSLFLIFRYRQNPIQKALSVALLSEAAFMVVRFVASSGVNFSLLDPFSEMLFSILSATALLVYRAASHKENRVRYEEAAS